MAHRSFASNVLAALAIALLSGCGGVVVEPAPAPGTGPISVGFEKGLTKSGGCGDVYLFVANPADTIAIVVDAKKFITPVTSHSETFTLPSAAIKVQVQVGSSLTQAACNDVVTSTPKVDSTYEATAGSVTLVTTPNPGGGPTSALSKASLKLENVTFKNGKGDTVVVPVFEVSNVLVGWYAG